MLGLAALRRLFEIRGPMPNQAFASLICGWYGGLVYLTPILGGLVADRLLGAKRTVVIGALLMSAGHLAMSFDASFLIALLLLILGSGFLNDRLAHSPAARTKTGHSPGRLSERDCQEVSVVEAPRFKRIRDRAAKLFA